MFPFFQDYLINIYSNSNRTHNDTNYKIIYFENKHRANTHDNTFSPKIKTIV